MRHPKHALSQDTASRPFKSSFCPSGTKKVSLALHGAFTWGVLDMLLEDGRFEIERVSGTSAGGMNAVADEEWETGGGGRTVPFLENHERRNSAKQPF